MFTISVKRNDIMGQFHNSLLLGDVASRVKILESAGQLRLAHMTAQTHGLTAEADALAEKLVFDAQRRKTQADPSDDSLPVIKLPAPKPNSKLLFPPIPINRLSDSNWPLLRKRRGKFDQILEQGNKFVPESVDLAPSQDSKWEPDEPIGNDTESKDQWGQPFEDPENISKDALSPEQEEEQGGEWEPDIDIPEISDPQGPSIASKDKFISIPPPGSAPAQLWCINSNLAADHVAAGSFESAMKLLNQQIGAVNFTNLKPYFLKLFMSSRLQLPSIPSLPPLNVYLNRNIENTSARHSLPLLPLDLASQLDKLQLGYQHTTKGKFSDALSVFQSILCSLPFIVVESRNQINEIKELIDISREYVVGLIMELKRKDVQNDPDGQVRNAELAAYFTNCNLQPTHLVLCLRSAINICVKLNNYGIAHSFANRLLDLNPPANVVNWTKKVARYCEQNQLKDSIEMRYNARNPFTVCGYSFTPIYRGNDAARCPYCSQTFLSKYNGQVCSVCQIAQIGKEVSGLQVFPSSRFNK
eukprot:TRINITY_DN10713_c0_g1_i1.p1 TRINITY_DN10713_c0_g1~~TRINITY_DN10713_c0_g1_i1.p1  ORF type:complete len:529 (-),score=105.56 TRINITY_DN10713_c0_g1_i1:19-1605(-)